jgi:hypothetical protein
MIKETVKDGTALTQQLLTGARRNKAQFELVCINRLIMMIPKWLEGRFPKPISINLALDEPIRKSKPMLSVKPTSAESLYQCEGRDGRYRNSSTKHDANYRESVARPVS